MSTPLRLAFSSVLLTLIAAACGGEQRTAEMTLDEFRLAAEQGNADAQYELADMYRGGQGVPRDRVEAERLYRLAAEQGYAEAQYWLGEMYSGGWGVPKDNTEAVRWLRMAAEQGHIHAQHKLGEMYSEGEGVPKDDTEAVRWYRMIAQQSDDDVEQYDFGDWVRWIAQFKLGSIYSAGEGVLKDLVVAHMWYNIASANGNGRRVRDRLEDQMTVTQIARASELARRCMESEYEDCGP